MEWSDFIKCAESELAKRRKLRREMKKRKNKPSTVKKYICGTPPVWKKAPVKWRNRPSIKGYWYTMMTYLHRDGTEKQKVVILSPREKKGKRPPLIVQTRRSKKGKPVRKKYPICKPGRKPNQQRVKKKSFAHYAEMSSREYMCATPLSWKTQNGKGGWRCVLKFKRDDGSIGTEPYIQSRNVNVAPRRVTVRDMHVPYCQGANCQCKQRMTTIQK